MAAGNIYGTGEASPQACHAGKATLSFSFFYFSSFSFIKRRILGMKLLARSGMKAAMFTSCLTGEQAHSSFPYPLKFPLSRQIPHLLCLLEADNTFPYQPLNTFYTPKAARRRGDPGLCGGCLLIHPDPTPHTC